jgi:hypothetical protein
MQKHLLPLAALPVALLTACIDAGTHIHINKDGSGTITETVLMEKQAAKSISGMMQSMSETLGGQKDKTLDSNFWWKKEDIEKRVPHMGEGVTLKSLEPCETDTGSGYKATFAFTDINKVSIHPDPNTRAPEQQCQVEDPADTQDTEQTTTGQPAPEATNNPSPDDNITFNFTPGSPAKLTINMPKTKDAEKTCITEQAQNEEANPFTAGMIGAMSQMFKGMRAKSTITVEGNIVQTNATYRDGDTITLMEIDFDKLLSDTKVMEKIMQNQEGSFGENMALLKDNPNVKYDQNNPITIEFR